MSELKHYIGPHPIDHTLTEYNLTHPTDHTLTEYYLKSEADNVLAEKDAEIAQLQAMLEERNKQVGELKEEIHNLRRSLIVARHEVAKARGKNFSNKYRENRAILKEYK